MELSLLLANKIAALLIICSIGYTIVKLKLLKLSDSEILSKLLLFICTPCALLNAYQIPFTIDKAIGLLIAFFLSIIAYAISIGLGYLLGKTFHLSNIEKMCVIYSNAGFFVMPIVQFIFGNDYIFYTCASTTCVTFLLWSHCKIVISGEKTIAWKKIVLNPNCIAIYIGIFLFVTQIHLPSTISVVLNDFSMLIGPLSMLIVGMLMAEQPILNLFFCKKAYLISVFRLLLVPIIVLLAFKIMSLFIHHAELNLIMLIVLWSIASPVGSMISQFCQLYGEDADYVGQITLLSVILCLVTMPLITYFL